MNEPPAGILVAACPPQPPHPAVAVRSAAAQDCPNRDVPAVDDDDPILSAARREGTAHAPRVVPRVRTPRVLDGWPVHALTAADRICYG